MEWNEEIDEKYPVKIRVRSYDRMGLLADVVGTISKLEANITKAKTATDENKIVESYFTIDVGSTEHLNRILSALKKIKNVQDIKRIG